MRSLALIALIATGCGSDPAADVCKLLSDRCALADDDVDACKKDVGAKVAKETAKKLVACGGKAAECRDLIACYTEVGGAEVENILIARGVGASTTPPDCLDFEVKRADCTEPDRSCEWDTDCPDETRCNKRLSRCFDPNGDCAGTPCKVDSACAVGERCNQLTGTCFKIAKSQQCMPCLRDVDCGKGTCVERVCQDAK